MYEQGGERRIMYYYTTANLAAETPDLHEADADDGKSAAAGE